MFNEMNVQMIEIKDEELTTIIGAGGFGECGECGFGFGPFITTFNNFNAHSVAFNTQTSFAQSNVNKDSFASIFF